MSVEAITEAVRTLERARGELQALSHTTEKEIESVARAFGDLAGHTGTLLNLAAAIVGCLENESVSSVLPRVQTLGSTVRGCIGERLQATTRILEAVTTEVKLLRQLSLVTSGQAEIALEAKELSVLTTIEMSRLGTVGAGFQYLAQELSDFSKAVTQDSQQLAGHTDGRRAAIEETRRVLSGELPRLQEELARIESDLESDLALVDSSLTQLSRTPVQFRTSVEEVAQQIAGVVAAVQANDITRQQIEHVEEAFALVSAKMLGAGNAQNDVVPELAVAYAGLTIQVYQLRTIKETVASWASQIRTCMDGILRVSATEVVGIGPVVIEQEREVSSQLGHIKLLERQSQAHSERLHRTLRGLSDLMQLVSQHLQKSKSVRADRLQLLTFNSIIEASRLGTQAEAILAIAKCIKGISAEWTQITNQSGHALEEILNLVKQTNEVMQVFSEANKERLREAQAQTSEGLENLRSAASFTAMRAQEMKDATLKMQSKTAEIGASVDLLDACFGRIDAVLSEIEGVRRQLEIDRPEVKERYDAAEVERLFSVSYTTEMERDVLRAALRGTMLPVVQQTFAGNSVELF